MTAAPVDFIDAPHPGFDRLVHADWSRHPDGRALALADRDDGGWHLQATRPVGPIAPFLDLLFDAGRRVLAGFDFPIGLPHAHARQAGLASFPDLLGSLGQGRWTHVADVCDDAREISLERPFYPRGPSAGRRQAELAAGLGVAQFADLFRRCERATPHRPRAACLFWTTGANQVGKAAIAGWQEVLQPSLARGARLWPFAGTLHALASPGRPVLAETYPAEALTLLGPRPRGWSKRRRDDRIAALADLAPTLERRAIRLAPALAAEIADGFGSQPRADDRFDALIGLLAMIEVADHRRPEGPPDLDRRFEGWILGQAAPPAATP